MSVHRPHLALRAVTFDVGSTLLFQRERRKPHPEIFLASLRALGASPRQAAHVGNSTAKDVAGARGVGMTAIRYAGVRDDTRDGPPASAVIHHFAALPDVLGVPGGEAFAA